MDSTLPDWPAELDTPLIERKHGILSRSVITKMESGRSRIRRMHLEPLEVVDVTWNFVADAYETFKTFFINELEQGSLPFSMTTYELDTDPRFSLHITRAYAFLDGTYSFTYSDNQFTVTATLEIVEVVYSEFFPSKHVGPPPITEGALQTGSFRDGAMNVPPEDVGLGVGLVSGEYFHAAIVFSSPTETGTTSVGFESGAYTYASLSVNLTDASSLSTGFLSGNYFLAIVSFEYPYADSSVTTGFLSGTYTLVAVAGEPQTEGSSTSVGFLSGSYTLA